MGLLSKIKKDLITAPLGQPKPSIGLQRLFRGVTPRLPERTRRSGFFPKIKRATDDMARLPGPAPSVTPPTLMEALGNITKKPEPISIDRLGNEPIRDITNNFVPPSGFGGIGARPDLPEPILQPLPQLIPVSYTHLRAHET